tara:strand:+ start:1618 stop:1899 length:282 start_codon:yes stop_codon:yes gene_type:complete
MAKKNNRDTHRYTAQAFVRNVTRGKTGSDQYFRNEVQNPAQQRSTGHNKPATLEGRLLKQKRARFMERLGKHDVSVTNYVEKRHKDTGPRGTR